jgi:hypothetical protein
LIARGDGERVALAEPRHQPLFQISLTTVAFTPSGLVLETDLEGGADRHGRGTKLVRRAGSWRNSLHLASRATLNQPQTPH